MSLRNNKTIRWGILGCGNVTEHKSGPAFRKAQGSELVAVMRRSPKLAQDYAQRHGIPHWYNDADALIADPEVDAVYVAAPVGAHSELCLKVAAAGKPAYVEKPMARNGPECARMLSAFQHAKQPLFVAYYRRALPRFLRARDLIASGALGKVSSIRYHYGSPSHRKPRTPDNWRLHADESGGGLFMDLGCHALDIIDFMLGPLESIGGTASNVASPDTVEDAVAMHFEIGGVPGVASWNFSEHRKIDRLEVSGTEGSLSMSVFGETPIQHVRGDTTNEITLANPDPIQQPLIQCIVDELLGEGTCASTGESALRTAWAMDSVLAGYYGGREDSFWERPGSWRNRQ